MNDRFVRARSVARVDLAHEPDFSLGPLHVRPSLRELVGDNCREILDPRVMRVLVALTRAKGDILSRDDLIESCWDGVIVGEDAITRCISRLRKVAEASGNAFSIETVSRVGYRIKIDGPFLARASDATESIAPVLQPNFPDGTPLLTKAKASSPAWRGGSAVAIAGASFILLVTGFGIWGYWSRSVPSPTASVTSVAVLPFANMSGDPAKDYFSDGFSEELLNDLSNDSRLRVAARTSAFAFKGKNEDVEAVAQSLRVGAVVEGSVREVGDHVRITVQLVNGSDGYTIWSAAYNRDLRDILKVQDEIARTIAGALTHRLLPASLSVGRRVDPAVYREYLEAVQLYNQFTRETFERATELLKHVTTAQPDFSDGFAEFARNRIRATDYDPVHADAYLAAAREAVQKALILDPQNIKAQIQHGLLQLAANDFTGATSDFRSLTRRTHDDLRVLGGLRVYYNEMGFPNEAIAVLKQARARDPLSDREALVMLEDLIKTGRYSEAIEMARALLVRLPNHPWVLGTLCEAYTMTNQIQEGRAFQQRLHALQPASATAPSPSRCDFDLDLLADNFAGARAIIRTWATKSLDLSDDARGIAESYVELHDFDSASEWFERDYDDRDDFLFTDAYWIGGAAYRKTASWKALTQRSRFKDWQAVHDRVAVDIKANGGHL